ncbi:ABC transporter ATP-binding protein [Euzebya tangerina]|uniref:ABC transporter ATP-binding protein n=1 Tax=Euzebya tangerina TaxID=591198 RepID=UPI000E310B60|nr:ABC transporter ATP-binding protein [Euzebya tangerina]
MLLTVEDLISGYGRLEVLHGVSLEVGEGEIISVLGANGAGKTTLLRTISGLLPTWNGTTVFDGATVTGHPPERVTAAGLGHLPEGRGILQTLTVAENLQIATVVRRDGTQAIAADTDRMLELFPPLAGRLSERAGALSGGQQQMLAIARSLMARPRLIMVDELSFGLAPNLVHQLFEVIVDLREQGTTFLLVEQHASVLDFSDRTYVIRTGRVAFEGPSAELQDADELVRSYLGGGGAPEATSGFKTSGPV